MASGAAAGSLIVLVFDSGVTDEGLLGFPPIEDTDAIVRICMERKAGREDAKRRVVVRRAAMVDGRVE